MAAHWGRRKARAAKGSRSARRSGARFRNRGSYRRIGRDCRAQHRPFSDWGGDLWWPGQCRQNNARSHGPRSRMILGIGSDLIDVRRIERTMERHGERFLARIFTSTERATAEGRARRCQTYPKRFAAKEACAKALGTGLRAGVFWRDLGAG